MLHSFSQIKKGSYLKYIPDGSISKVVKFVKDDLHKEQFRIDFLDIKSGVTYTNYPLPKYHFYVWEIYDKYFKQVNYKFLND